MYVYSFQRSKRAQGGGEEGYGGGGGERLSCLIYNQLRLKAKTAKTLIWLKSFWK